MKKTKILVAFALVSIMTVRYPTSIYADVDGYVIKDSINSNLYQYSEEEILSSFRSKRRRSEDGYLYEDFMNKLNGGEIYLLHDDSGKYISYEEAVKEFEKKKANNEVFDIHQFARSAEVVDSPEYVYDRMEKNRQVVNELNLTDDNVKKDFKVHKFEKFEDLRVTGDNVTIANADLKGNLTLDPGEEGSVFVNNVKVNEIKVLSGGQDSIHLYNTDAKILDVSSDDKKNIKIVVDGETIIGKTKITTYTIFDKKLGTLGIIVVTSASDKEKNEVVELRGTFTEPVIVETGVTLRVAEGTVVPKLEISPENKDAEVNLEGNFREIEIKKAAKVNLDKGSKITGSLKVTAQAEITVYEKAYVSKVEIAPKNKKAQIKLKGKFKKVEVKKEARLNLEENTNVSTLQVNADLELQGHSTASVSKVKVSGNAKVEVVRNNDNESDENKFQIPEVEENKDSGSSHTSNKHDSSDDHNDSGNNTINSISLDNVGINVASGKITNTTTNMQYSLDSTNGTDGTWRDCTDGSTSVIFRAGKVYVRQANKTSNYRQAAEISAPAEAPKVTVDDAESTAAVLKGVALGMEFNYDNKGWRAVTEEHVNGTKTFDLQGAQTLIVRTAATTDTLASKATVDLDDKDVPDSINLDGVKVDIASGKISNTTTKMQYSLNSTNGIDGTWMDCTDGSTLVEFKIGKVYIRQKNKISNVRFIREIEMPKGEITASLKDDEYICVNFKSNNPINTLRIMSCYPRYKKLIFENEKESWIIKKEVKDEEKTFVKVPKYRILEELNKYPSYMKEKIQPILDADYEVYALQDDNGELIIDRSVLFAKFTSDRDIEIAEPLLITFPNTEELEKVKIEIERLTPYSLTDVLGNNAVYDCLDDYEQDNSYTEAKLISTDGVHQTRTIYPASDEDWIKFEAEEGHMYSIETSNFIGKQMRTVMYLYNTDGETELEHSHYYPSKIVMGGLQTGTYYVKILHYFKNYGWDDPDAVGQYDVSITKTLDEQPQLSDVVVSSVDHKSGEINLTSNMRGTVCYVVLDKEAAPPNAEQIKRGYDGSSKPQPAFLYGNKKVDKGSNTINVRGLTPSSEYKVYMVLDYENYRTSEISEVTFATEQDANPPKLADIDISDVKHDSIELSLTSDEDGFITYAVVSPSYTGGLSKEDIVEGNFESIKEQLILNGLVSINEGVNNVHIPEYYGYLKQSTEYKLLFVVRDINGNITEISEKSFTTAAEPLRLDVFRDISYHDSVEISLIANKTGKVYCVVLPKNAQKPSGEQVKAGQDANGNAALSVHSIDVVGKEYSSEPDILKITGLQPATAYTVYIVGEDKKNGSMSEILGRNIYTKDLPMELTIKGEPILIEDSVKISFSPEKDGYVYCTVLPEDEAAPGRMAVVGSVADKDSLSAHSNVSKDAEASIYIDGLEPLTKYTAYLVTKTSKGSLSEVKEIDFTSAAQQPIIFRDPNLEKVIRSEINKLSDDIYKSDVKKIRKLYLYNEYNITDLSDIENLTGLEDLRLENNSINDIGALDGLTGLKYLSLRNNKINDISILKRLKNLQYLNLKCNKVRDISVLKGLPNLQYIHLSDNNISDISVLKGLTKLQFLTLSDNNISDISALKGLTNLRYLCLYSNPIIDYTPIADIYRKIEYKDFTIYKTTLIISDGTNVIEGANIVLEKKEPESIKSQTKVSDGNGEVMFYLENGEYTYTVTADGYNELQGIITVNNGEVTKQVKMKKKSSVEEDTDAPEFGSQTTAEAGEEAGSIRLSVDLNEVGTVYYMVLESDSTTQQAIDIQGTYIKDALENNVGNTTGSAIRISDVSTPKHITIKGLKTDGTKYDIYLTAEDKSKKLQDEVKVIYGIEPKKEDEE
jgi:hypothetical protein